MTLLVASRCRLLRLPHGSLGVWQRLQRPPATTSTRAIAHAADSRPAHKQQSPSAPTSATKAKRLRRAARIPEDLYRAEDRHLLTPDIKDSEIVPVHSAILIPASIAAVTPDHFVEKIEPIQSSWENGRFVVFLTTPSFAPWLLDPTVFLEKAVGKLYENRPPGTVPSPLYALCAVVDRLPDTHLAGDGGREVMLSAFRDRTRQPPVAGTGHEGFAYVVLPSKAHSSPALDSSRVEDVGCLDFSAHTHTDVSGRHYTRLQVPLANTVFQTGQPSTLIRSSWRWSPAENKFALKHQSQKKTAAVNLSSQDVQNGELPSHLHREAPTLSVPLLPLTVPRQVDGCMGNIIRGLVGAGEIRMTASTELEQAVPRYFESRGEPAQATSAWALIIPRKTADVAAQATQKLVFHNLGADPKSLSSDAYAIWEQKGFESLWQSQPPRWNTTVQEAMSSGARLHKVLSGGGGWGKKAGLLSLDPMPISPPVFQTKKDSKMDNKTDEYDSVHEFSTALKPVVEDGDYVQFFISPVPAQGDDDAAAFQNLKEAEIIRKGHPWNWEFGVIPSTIDSVPGESWQHTGESREIAVFRGSFGALTERGLTLTHSLGIQAQTGRARKNLLTTKVDVPFSRWSAIRLHPKEGIETGRVGDFHKGRTAQDLLREQLMYNTSNATVAARSLKRTSLPFGDQRPQHTHTHSSISNALGARAKSTFSKLKSMYVGEEAQPASRTSDKPIPQLTQKKIRRASQRPGPKMKARRLALRRRQKRRGCTPRRVTSSGMITKVLAQHVRHSGRILVRMTRELRLLTGLKLNQLEGLRVWRARNGMEHPASSPNGRKRPVVRKVGVSYSANMDSSSADFTGKQMKERPLYRKVMPKPQPNGDELPLIRKFKSGPAGHLETSPYSPRNIRATLGNLHHTLRTLIARIRILKAQTAARLPNTPVPITKYSSRIAPRSRLSRRPDQLAARVRKTTPLVSLPLRTFRAAIRPMREKLRYSVVKKGARARRMFGQPTKEKRPQKEKTLEEDVWAWLTGGKA